MRQARPAQPHVQAGSNARPMTGIGASQMRPTAQANMPPTQQRQYQYKQNIRNPQDQVAMAPVQPIQQVAAQAVVIPGMLAAALPQEQKQMLGERLFPLIQQMHSELAGKITGMLLEIDNSELLHMLESPESLKAKEAQAVAVLSAHQAKEASRVAPVKKEAA